MTRMTRDEIDTICTVLVQSGHPHKARLIHEHDVVQQDEIELLKREVLVNSAMIDGLIKQVAQAQHDRDYYKRELGNTQARLVTAKGDARKEVLAEIQMSMNLQPKEGG